MPRNELNLHRPKDAKKGGELQKSLDPLEVSEIINPPWEHPSLEDGLWQEIRVEEGGYDFCLRSVKPSGRECLGVDKTCSPRRGEQL